MEGGPDAFISEKPWAMDLCKRVGLEDQLIGTRQEFRRSFVYQKGKLVPVPTGFYLMAPRNLASLFQAPLLSFFGKLRMACELFIPPKKEKGDESVASFVRRRFGREALEKIGQPMIGGIYTADPESLSLQATFPQFLQMEEKYGSVIRALDAEKNKAHQEASGPRYGLFLTLKNGMEHLIAAIIRKMPEVVISSGKAVSKIGRDNNKWNIQLENGEKLEADAICLAVPAFQAAKLTRPFDAMLARELEKIPYESSATVNMVFDRKDIPHALDGFGFVVPASEKRKIIGCTFVNVKFPGRATENKILLRVFMGGALGPRILDASDADLESTALAEIQEILKISKLPEKVLMRRYPRSMPQYEVGHLQTVATIEESVKKHPGFYLTGNAYRGIGLPDCVRQAEKAAKAISQFLEQRV